MPNLHSAIPSVIHSAVRNAIRRSKTIHLINGIYRTSPGSPRPWSRGKILALLACLVLGLAVDVYRLVRGALRVLLFLPLGVPDLARRVYNRLQGMYSSLKRSLTQQTTAPNLRCISWTLQTSLDKSVHLQTLKHLVAITDLTGLDPSLAMNYLNVFVGCLGFINHKVVVIQGLEQLATVSATCFFHTFRHLTTVDSASSVLATVRRRYDRMFPFDADFKGLSFYCTMIKIHALVSKDCNPRNFEWDYYKPPGRELTPFARHMAEVTQVEHEDGDVPRWILLFAFRCLMIIATNLGCRLSDFMTLDEKYRYSHSMGAHFSDQGLVHARNNFQASSSRSSKHCIKPRF